MHGDLARTSAAEACRKLAATGATGVLHIDGPNGQATIGLAAGQVTIATSPGVRTRLGDRLIEGGFLDEASLAEVLEAQQRSLGQVRLGSYLVEEGLVPREAVRLSVQEQTIEALLELVQWREGSFRFEAGGPGIGESEIPVALFVDDALLEVARRQEPGGALAEVVPDLRAVPVCRVEPVSVMAALEPDEFAVLASLDGQRDIGQLCYLLGSGPLEMARIVYGLVLIGAVEVRHAEPGPSGGASDAAGTAEPLGEPLIRPGGIVLEIPLPEASFSDVLRELRALDRDEATVALTRSQAATEGSRPSAADAGDPPSEPSTSPASASVHAGWTSPIRRPREDPDGEVAEFLRELSRLSLDDDLDDEGTSASRAAAPREAPEARPAASPPKRRRRGLFGR